MSNIFIQSHTQNEHILDTYNFSAHRLITDYNDRTSSKYAIEKLASHTQLKVSVF